MMVDLQGSGEVGWVRRISLSNQNKDREEVMVFCQGIMASEIRWIPQSWCVCWEGRGVVHTFSGHSRGKPGGTECPQATGWCASGPDTLQENVLSPTLMPNSLD